MITLTTTVNRKQYFLTMRRSLLRTNGRKNSWMKEYNQYSHLSDTRSSGYTDNFGVFFRTFVRNQRTSWARYVKIIQNIINITRHESTGFTPMELHFNIKPMRVWEKWLPLIDSNKMTHKQKIFFARERAYSFLKKQASRKNDQT